MGVGRKIVEYLKAESLKIHRNVRIEVAQVTWVQVMVVFSVLAVTGAPYMLIAPDLS